MDGHSYKSSNDFNKGEIMQYFRIDYTDYEWFVLMKKLGENLPSEYHNCFDDYGIYTDEVWELFTVDIYITKEN